MFSDPRKNIEQFGLRLGMSVADLGSGSGFYVEEASKVVGDRGVVYAVDIQKELLVKTKNQTNQKGLYNIEVVWGDAEKIGGTKLRDSSLDAVIISNLLFQVESKENVLLESARILKPKGKILIVDWTDSFGGLGPLPEAVFGKEKVIDILETTGFVFEKEIDAGKNHYGIIAIKK